MVKFKKVKIWKSSKLKYITVYIFWEIAYDKPHSNAKILLRTETAL